MISSFFFLYTVLVNIFFCAGLVIKNCLHLCLSWYILVSQSIWSNSLRVSISLGWWLFRFQILKYHSILSWVLGLLIKKNMIFVPLCVSYYFSLITSLILLLDMIYHEQVLLVNPTLGSNTHPFLQMWVILCYNFSKYIAYIFRL